ncbi:hypothetical protein FB45DRAFT_806647 [Roridomyces roridus]|uniref:BTB domain-containing protein n=1 Tax=Roridomyces roridus TaxID=1738132 RepID=A0AAD7B1H8_9AGAR|nr:hypothetical protein FB45DRAFT_806647 [Roridomyces roridus]
MDATRSSQESTRATNLTRVPDLWFPEGGLVLRAGNRIFRVASSILAARSSVFGDILSIPQPDHQPLIDGCPIVVLHDAEQDAEHFLRAIFDSSFFERPPAPTPFQVIAGILKLSTKYDVAYLRRRALLHIASISPRSVAEYDTMGFTPDASLQTPRELFSRLLLFDSLDLTWAMPAALYAVTCCTVQDIFDGIPADATGNDPIQLTPALQRTCLVARTTLLIAQNHETFRFLRAARGESCTAASACRRARSTILENFTKQVKLAPLGYLVPERWGTIPLCSACKKASLEMYDEARRTIWEQLPSIFGLPTWEEMEQMRKADVDEV